MANWTVQRIEHTPGVPAPLSCGEGEQPVKVTMYDKDTKVTNVVWACQFVGDLDPCYILNQLRDAGYTPNDWTVECP
jgi:hypothetical protein